MALSKWITKFEKSFFNHLDGEWGVREYLSKNINLKLEYIEGQGGHNADAFGKSIKLKSGTVRIPEPPIDDLPFKAEIEIKYKNGEWLKKLQTSSMFPKNWNIERIQEEVAWVYENTVAKNIGFIEENIENGISKYRGKSTNGFTIQIEIKEGSIINSYPIIK